MVNPYRSVHISWLHVGYLTQVFRRIILRGMTVCTRPLLKDWNYTRVQYYGYAVAARGGNSGFSQRYWRAVTPHIECVCFGLMPFVANDICRQSKVELLATQLDEGEGV